MNELGTQLVDEGHPNAEDIQTTTEKVNSRFVHKLDGCVSYRGMEIYGGSYFMTV